jgi:hypothetical protein
MFQVRIHGRGRQGVVTGAEMLSIAAFFRRSARPSRGCSRICWSSLRRVQANPLRRAAPGAKRPFMGKQRI